MISVEPNDLRRPRMLRIGSLMVPRAIADVRKALPNLLIEVDILKIEDAVDYLLLGKGELVALSYKLDHSLLAIEPLARGRLKCIVPEGHVLARRTRVTADEIVKHPLIGVDPDDPYGRIMALCTRVLVLAEGRLIAEGAPQDIRRNPSVVEAYLGH